MGFLLVRIVSPILKKFMEGIDWPFQFFLFCRTPWTGCRFPERVAPGVQLPIRCPFVETGEGTMRSISFIHLHGTLRMRCSTDSAVLHR